MTLWRTRPMFPGLIGLIRLQYGPMIVTFNHGVPGSNPGALTKNTIESAIRWRLRFLTDRRWRFTALAPAMPYESWL
jgi:hypothetical protein